MGYGFQVFDSSGILQMSETGSTYKLDSTFTFNVPAAPAGTSTPAGWVLLPGGSVYHYPVILSAPQITDINEWDYIWDVKVISSGSGSYISAWAYHVNIEVGQISISVAASNLAPAFTQTLKLVRKV
jgi:hypothetical protein